MAAVTVAVEVVAVPMFVRLVLVLAVVVLQVPSVLFGLETLEHSQVPA
jgi:hypothetical protein